MLFRSLPTRLAGMDTANKPFGGKDSEAKLLNVDKYGLSQYPTSGKLEIKSGKLQKAEPEKPKAKST